MLSREDTLNDLCSSRPTEDAADEDGFGVGEVTPPLTFLDEKKKEKRRKTRIFQGRGRSFLIEEEARRVTTSPNPKLVKGLGREVGGREGRERGGYYLSPNP